MIDVLPLISCVCITRDKPELLKRAIDCFLNQTYPNKQLVVLYEDIDELTKAFFKTHTYDSSVVKLEVSGTPKLTIGKLRNYAISKADGEFISQWDDDDWYHVKRLENGYRYIQQTGKDGAILTRWMVFDCVEQQAYISNRRLWEGSVICRKDAMLEKGYDDLIWGEDTPIIEYLHENKKLALIEQMPLLYIYIYHGSNSWNYDHWKEIFKASLPLNDEDNSVVQKIISNEYTIEAASAMLDSIYPKYRSAVPESMP
jgi:glycosyltransferase involved in cell wall biosynthesis